MVKELPLHATKILINIFNAVIGIDYLPMI